MENTIGIGEVSGEMAEERAKELALIAGRPVLKEDYEQAIRELTGGPEKDEQQCALESTSEEERWKSFPDATGHQVAEHTSDEEDEDGRGESAQLVEEGVSEAEHDQMLQAAKAEKNEQRADRQTEGIPKPDEKKFSPPAILADLVDYQEGSVASKKLVSKKAGTITLYAFDKGQGFSEHQAPYDAIVCVLDGVAVISIAGKKQNVVAGHILTLPARVPHALQAEERFKMMLTMIRS